MRAGASCIANVREVVKIIRSFIDEEKIKAIEEVYSYQVNLLKRKEESVKISDKLGLELEVMDYYTGKKRDIKSLSGGESFKAS